MELEELVEKHTRRELEKTAYELGIDATDLKKFSNKTKIAEAILMARGKPLKTRIGRKGVFAKLAAIDRTVMEVERSVKRINSEVRSMVKGNIEAAERMHDEGARALNAGVKELQMSIKTQVKMNADAAAKIDAGAIEVQKGIGAQAMENADTAKRMLDEAATTLEEGAKELQKGIAAQVQENSTAAKKIGTGVRDLQSQIKDMRSAIKAKAEEINARVKALEADAKEMRLKYANYSKDFYYG